jgi:signal transduction histidine kinase/ligand-binding sensor domain-containing protein
MQRNTIFLAYFFICVNCFSQQYPFVYYTPKDGLINSRVRSIKQDSKGRMLFTTYGGLSIYDGTRFTNYNQQDGLANELVNDIVEIAPDSFWVATNTQKLNTLVHGKVGVYQTADHFYPTVNRFCKAGNGTWYAAADEGLFEFKNKKFTRLPLNKNGKDLGNCLDKLIDWENFLLIIPWNTQLSEKLILYNKQTQTVDDIITDRGIVTIETDSKNKIWASTSNGIQLLDLPGLRKGKIIFEPAALPYRSLKSAGLLFDASDNAWFFNSNEIQRISLQFQKQVFSTEQGLKAGTLSCLFKDKEGIMWIGTDGSGVIKLKSTKIQLLSSIEGKAINVSDICQVKDTTWLFNRLDHCIYRITAGETKKFPLPNKISVAKISSYQDKLYLLTNEGLLLINKKKNSSSYMHPHVFFSDSSVAAGDYLLDPYGTIIDVVAKNGSHHLSIIRKNKALIQYDLDALADRLVLDKAGRLWTVSRTDHIMAFSLNPFDSSHYLRLIQSFSKGVSSMGARCITVDKENGLWIGTRYNGLYHFLFTGHQLYLKDHYTTKNGLTDNFIFTLACDSNNAIWVGTQTGLDKIFKRGNNHIIANIGKNNNNFQFVTKIEIANDGTVWSLNNDGTILKVSPEPSSTDHPAPELLLTSVKMNNEEWNEAVRNFSYKENSFSFTVAAPSFIDEKSIRYSYFLEGSNNTQWSEPSNLAAFSFVNLRPGHYTLHVRCYFPESMYPSQEIKYSFVIQQPWWKSWWFIVSLILFITTILVLAIRNYYRRKLQKQKILLEKKQAIEKERTRIATDMHDDLGAGLSRIKFLSETIGIKKQQQQPIEEDVIKIREYSHQMIDKMGEIVWALNERNDSISDLIAYTRAYAMEYLSQSGIDCTVELPKETNPYCVSGEFRRNIFLSMKEILHNIVKHAQASCVVINIEIKKELIITVKDNGKGFGKDKIRPFSNGLYNVEKRMKDINGRSEIKIDNGTAVILFAPFS